MSLSPSQTEAIAASVSQARGSKVHNASKRPAPPTGHLNEQPQYTPLARQSLPPNSNPKEQPTDSPPAKSPSPPPSRSPSLSIDTQNHSAHQDDADALTFQLLGLSLYPAEPKIYPPPTEAEFLRQESQQGHGYLILRDEPDELNAHNEYFLSFEEEEDRALRAARFLFKYSSTEWWRGAEAGQTQTSNHYTPRVGNFVHATSSISTEWADIVFRGQRRAVGTVSQGKRVAPPSNPRTMTITEFRERMVRFY